MTPNHLIQTRQAEQARQQRLKDRVFCCTVAGCLSAGARTVRTALQEQVDAQGPTGEIEICGTGCMGLCSRGPLVRSSAGDIIYAEVKLEEAGKLLSGDRSHFEGRIIEPDHPFFMGQRRIILANSGKV